LIGLEDSGEKLDEWLWLVTLPYKKTKIRWTLEILLLYNAGDPARRTTLMAVKKKKETRKVSKKSVAKKVARKQDPDNRPIPSPSDRATTPASHAETAFPIVGMGASAGGLEALREFFGHMESGTQMACVVVTHQHPGHVSLLPELLSKTTRMKVVEAKDGLKVERNHAYIGSPGEVLGIAGGVLYCIETEAASAPHLPIDHFFRSLAADRGKHAIGIVLSGTGTDGTFGVKAIKAEGGMVMVQNPTSAKYAGMPSSATATGLADFIMVPADMPSQLSTYIKGPYLTTATQAPETAVFPREILRAVLRLLRGRTNQDFSSYKPTTIRRRIERRMSVHQIREPEAYVCYLQSSPHEIDTLFSELLISVTSFFRDPEAYVVLAEEAIPGLLIDRQEDHTLRVWIPGCATGEEAYSVAMVLHECMEKHKKRVQVQMFGTDLDPRAIGVARKGVYEAGIKSDVSEDRLEKYFLREDGTYQVRKELREMLIFATQSVIRDPPFTKMDLIVCRNLLIYLDGEAQRRLFPAFHYALRPQGLLFLGPSESVGGFQEMFEPIDAKWKIYRRRETATRFPPGAELPDPRREVRGEDGVSEKVIPAHLALKSLTTRETEKLLLARFAPASVFVDGQGTVVYIHGRTGAYLEPAEGQHPRNNLLEMAREGLGPPLAAALRRAAERKEEVVRSNLQVKANGEFTGVDLTVTRIEEPEAIRGLFLVTMRPSGMKPASKKSKGKKEARAESPNRVRELEEELRFTRESLQTTIEELETSNEELTSTNEELQSTNEELQSANEELETSKEELQSLNEELTTVNAELQNKLDDLDRSNDDMQNLLNSTRVATIFLDEDLRVKRYTEEAKDLFHLIQADIGRPLSDLSSQLEVSTLLEDCRAVLKTLAVKEKEVRDSKNAWYSMRIMPYRTSDNMIDGVVITLMEIDHLKQMEQRAKAASEYFESIVQTVREPLLVLDASLKIVFANTSFCEAFRVRLEDTKGTLLYEVGQGQWDIPELRRLLDEVLPERKVFADFRVDHEFPEIGRRVFLLNARTLALGEEESSLILLAMEDVTERDSR
jgi:two-component system CheB/CheR fusion protein